MTFKVGDKVKVIADVWDDHLKRSWQGWIGVIESINDPKSGPQFPIYVVFSKEFSHNYDFAPGELWLVEENTQ